MKVSPVALLSVSVVSLMLVGAVCGAASAASAPTAVRPRKAAARSRSAPALSYAFMYGLAESPVHLALAPLDLAEIGTQDAQSSRLEKTLRVGVVRALPEAVTLTRAESRLGEWAALDDGAHVWRLTVKAGEACGVRLHLAEVSLPEGCELRVSDALDPLSTRGPYTAASLGRRTGFWTGTVFAECVTLECYAPAGVDPAAVTFTVDQLTHLYRDPARVAKKGGCENDATCFPDWAAAANGVAGIGSYSYADYIWCTGCLMNDLDESTWTDYFLTANHCVANQLEADDTEFYWFFQTATCDGAAPAISSVTVTDGGAEYLAGKTEAQGSDFAFLKLRKPSPDGASFLGWSSKAPAEGEAVTCIHHPLGEYKRISFGVNVDGDADFRYVQWSSGVTAEGSSGSPLFNASNEVIGQLWGGESTCENPTGLDYFGRFDVTYKAISPWLDGTKGSEDIFGYLCDPLDQGLTTPGSYDGYFFNEDAAGATLATSVRGTFSLQVSRVAGLLSAKAVLQKQTLSFTARSWTDWTSDGTFLAVMTTRAGETLDLYVRQDRIWGMLSGGAIGKTLYLDGARNRFADRADTAAQAVLEGYRGYYTVALPGDKVWPYGSAGLDFVGTGYLTLTVGNNGGVKVAGKLPDDTSVSRSSRLIYYGDCGDWACVPLFAPLYSAKGWLGGLLWLNPSNGVAVIDEDLGWKIRWEKPVTAPDGLGALLFPCGGYYNTGAPLAVHYRLSAEKNAVRYHVSGRSFEPQQAAFPERVGVASAGSRLVAEKGVAPIKVGDAYVYTGANSALATLSFAATTGIYKGSFNLYYDYTLNGRLTHKVVKTNYSGVLTQTRLAWFSEEGWPEGLGYYLVTDNDPVYKPSSVKRSFWMDLYIAP